MTDEGQPHDEQGRFVVSHGGDAGLKSLAAGGELRGLAAESARQVEAELATDGRAAIVQRAAIRLESVARLFYNAILSATESGDFEKLALYAQRFGWLQARALSAWEQLRREAKDHDGDGDAMTVIAKYREAAKDDDGTEHS